VTHEQVEDARDPAATVYRLDGAAAKAWREEVLASIAASTASWSPSTRFDAQAEIVALPTPVELDHGLQLVGYDLATGSSAEAGDVLELITVWRAGSEIPAAASDLKTFVHLLDHESRVWAAEDRLDLQPPTWEEGDLLVQHHRLPVPSETPAGEYQLELGVYTTIRMQRLRVYAGDRAVSDRVLLQPIVVSAP
jgi:hypothetical protein